MSFNVTERGTNRKRVYELQLVVYSNFRRITHRFRDTSCFNAENYIFVTDGRTTCYGNTALCIISRGKKTQLLMGDRATRKHAKDC